ncbi:glycyl-tRNA synthetase [Pelagophyceae sp. CCMP2097]|nr:glycyl-tRNA synthetase [Pelagophyceae sp. CCMP2097]
MKLASGGMLLLASSARALLARHAPRRAPQRFSAAAPVESTEAKVEAPFVAKAVTMDDVVQLCKKRGFVFGSSEIYNGFNGFYDYGPLGVELKANIKERWWRDMVRGRDNVYGLDSSIIASPKIWEASGHVAGFSDPMVDDKTTKKRYRADQLFYADVIMEGGASIGCVTVLESADTAGDALKQATALKRKLAVQGEIAPLALLSVADVDTPEVLARIPPPDDASRAGDLTMPVAFNLMFKTSVGAKADSSADAFLRPETAQGIFVNFKNVAGTARAKVPFGIAQIGKAFRNEITPRNFIFRSREFEQMEIEYFVEPGEGWVSEHAAWVEACRSWLVESVGLRPEMLGFEVHDKLAHYARACTDVTFKFPFGDQELLGVAARGDFDLQQHQRASGKSLDYFDEASKAKFVPHVIEPSIGVDRLFLAVLCSAYDTDMQGGEERAVLRLSPAMAPVKCCVLPLLKKNDDIMAISRDIEKQLRRRFNVEFDVSGAIGRRYRRQDEIGTPFCVTVDFDTLEGPNKGTVTIRDRDTTEQRRIPIEDVYKTVAAAVDGF